jgi:hypothetical protein
MNTLLHEYVVGAEPQVLPARVMLPKAVVPEKVPVTTDEPSAKEETLWP